jgi:hypothetical protein
MTVMLTCNDANVLIVRTIDDARLSGGERVALRRHLTSCARCRVEYETQHEVRRLLVLHIQDRLPAGFDERLRARLAQTSRPLPAALPASSLLRSDVARGMPAPFTAAHRPGTRGREWALRLIPLAATLMLIVAGTFVRDVSRQSVVGPRSAASSDATQPRAFTTIVLPRDNKTSRSRRPSSVSADAEEVASAPARSPVDEGERHGAVAAATAVAAAEHASRAAKGIQGTSDGIDRVPASDPSGHESERVAKREGDIRGGRPDSRPSDGEDVDGEQVGGERAASQQPAILPRPPAPIPHARPAMPAPFPDRTIPPP